MEAIEQLKAVRDGARQRLENNPDYKLIVALDDLISDLETTTNEVGKEATASDQKVSADSRTIIERVSAPQAESPTTTPEPAFAKAPEATDSAGNRPREQMESIKEAFETIAGAHTDDDDEAAKKDEPASSFAAFS